MENVFIKEEPADGAHSPHATAVPQRVMEPQPPHWVQIDIKRETSETSEDESSSPPQHSPLAPTVKVEEYETNELDEEEDVCSLREQDALAQDVTSGKEPRVRTNPTEVRLRTDIFHCPQKATHTKRKLCARCSARKPPIKRRVTSECDTCSRGLCLGECWRDFHTKADLA